MNNRDEKTRLSLRSILLVMIVVSVAILPSLIYTMYQTNRQYVEMRDAMQAFAEYQKSVAQLNEGVAYLTDKARNYVVSGDPEQVVLYYNEALVTRRRDTAIADLADRVEDETVANHIRHMPRIIDRMMELETYAMRLMVYGRGDDIVQFPDQLREIRLKPEHIGLSPTSQQVIARGLLFSSEYDTLQAQLDTRVNRLQVMIDELLAEQLESSDRLLRALKIEQWLAGGLMVFTLVCILLIFELGIRPLRRQIARISNGELLDSIGSSELQFLANAYNVIFSQIQRDNRKLGYEASHDALTGLLNRGTFNRKLKAMEDDDIALLIIDVDRFKEINDTFGHDVGDKLLRRVSIVLQSSFRRSDSIYRIGGDEFAVIVTGVRADFTEALRQKIVNASKRLAFPVDDLPDVTLSVGIAFSDTRPADVDLFKCADIALYKVKENGRNGCGFYHLTDSENA